MALKAIQALVFFGLFATSCLAQSPVPAPAPMTVESPPPPPAMPPTAELPPPVASPPVPVTEPTPPPTTPPTVSPPTKTPTISPTISPVASPPKHKGLAPVPSVFTPVPAPSPVADGPSLGSAFTNKAFLVSTVVAGAFYAVVLA